MYQFNHDVKGTYVPVTSKAGQQFLIPFWNAANQQDIATALVNENIVLNGADVIMVSTRSDESYKIFFNQQNYKDIIQQLEADFPGVNIVSNKAYDFQKAATPLTTNLVIGVPAYIPSVVLDKLTQDARLLGVRPFGDPELYKGVLASLDRAAGPA